MKQIYNPFLSLNEYIPDGEPHVFGDRVYIYGSHDKEGGETFCMLDYVVYSAPITDLKDWKYEGVIYSSSQDPNNDGRRIYMYAPDVVRGNDGRFYLYYALAGDEKVGGGFDGPISVAVSDTPAGKFQYHGDVQYPDGTPVKRMIPFDPAVINDEGVIRLYYGWALAQRRPRSPIGRAIITRLMQKMFSKTKNEIRSEPEGIMGANTVELADDMITVKSEIKRIVPGRMAAEETSFADHAFFEASSIRKIKDTYYFIYSSHLMHELCYATSKYPDKDFVFGGTIVSSGDIGYRGRKAKDRLNTTGNNHGSIENINGEWYVFYHRHTHNTTFSRQACAEKIKIESDGSIPQVEITSCGLNGGPLMTKGEYPAPISSILTDGKMKHKTVGRFRPGKTCVTHRDNERFITEIKNGVVIGYRYFRFKGAVELNLTIRGKGKGSFLVKTDVKGKVLGKIPVHPDPHWHSTGTALDITGEYPLILHYKGTGRIDFLSFSFT
ncbi:MAG: family 43 glycosylhydrolase [Spirochaetales bacterium]|nr:family 43 glycosylhydrolase [Spirochaetales bacterium]